MSGALFDKMLGLLKPLDPVNAVDPNKSYLVPIFLVIINLLFTLAGAVAMIAIIYGGIMYITASGDESKTSKARAAIINGVVSAVIVIMSLAIIRIMKNIFG